VAAPKPAPAPAAAPAEVSGAIRVELQRLMDNWPQAVTEEVAELGLKDQFVELPMGEIESGLRSGKIVFTWNQVRGWMPAVAKVIATSPNDSAPLELPLRVIAPLFLAQKKVGSTGPKAKSADFDAIPNLFGPGAGAATPQVANAAPVAAPASKPVAPPVASSAPIKMAAPAPAPAVVKPKPQTIAEVLGGEPGANTTPGEIARRAASLSGMSGALICTNDGLVVAEHFVSPVGSETFCALMTQMFNRVTGYAKELRLGGPTEVGFVIDGATYQVFQTPRVFVIAVGKPGEALPVHELRIIAEYLGK
jgi:predicted regulator of Ras-like GTPase activity (Roadblock/LC7/MglB family)